MWEYAKGEGVEFIFDVSESLLAPQIGLSKRNLASLYRTAGVEQECGQMRFAVSLSVLSTSRRLRTDFGARKSLNKHMNHTHFLCASVCGTTSRIP